jgi:GTP-binding protein Era
VKSALVAIVGRANAGKSSLLNAFLGETVSVVSPVSQTTRRAIHGVLTEDGVQVVFTDTPGIRAATHALGSLLNRTARGLVTGSDLALLVIDGSRPPRDEDSGWMTRLARDEVPILCVLNKCDLGCEEAAYRAAWDGALAALRKRDPGLTPPPVRWCKASAKTGEGVKALLEAAFASAKECEKPLYGSEVLTDDPRPLFIADVIREKINARLADELPHACAVETTNVEEDEGEVRVSATIYVEKHSQRPILVGHKARMIRAIRRAAEEELEAIYEKPHRLDLWVKVEENWTRNYWLLRRLGYLN